MFAARLDSSLSTALRPFAETVPLHTTRSLGTGSGSQRQDLLATLQSAQGQA